MSDDTLTYAERMEDGYESYTEGTCVPYYIAESLAEEADATIASLRQQLADAHEAAVEWEGHCIAMRPSLRTPEDIAAAKTIAALRADVQRLERENSALATEASWLGGVMDERDENADKADELAYRLACLLGVSIGEHSNVNCPWDQAIAAADARLEERDQLNETLEADLAAALQRIAELEGERAQLRERDFRTGWAFGWAARAEGTPTSTGARADRQRDDWEEWITAEETPDV